MRTALPWSFNSSNVCNNFCVCVSGRDSEILIAKLEEEKKINSHILEKFNFDPVTKIKLDPTEEFESLLMMQKKSKQSELNLILNVFEEQMCKLGSRLDEI